MSAEKIEREAAEWLARLERGASAADRDEFDAWRAADPRHDAAYLRLAATWARLDRLRALGPQGTGVSSYAAVTSGNVASRTSSRVSQDRVANLRGFGIAAALLLFMSAGALGVLWQSRSANVYETTVGDFRRVALEDGSVVELNTDSRIRVRLNGTRRDVFLDRGEASFTVSHDKARPFSVIVDGISVRATGTQFVVRRLKDIEVVVTEGAVAILPRSAEQPPTGADLAEMPIVDAGHAARVDAAGVQLESLSEIELDRRTSWQRGMLLFRDSTLAEIVNEFNRYSARKLIVADPEVARLRMGGYFKATNAAEFVEVLEQNYGIRVVRDGKSIVLLGANTQGSN